MLAPAVDSGAAASPTRTRAAPAVGAVAVRDFGSMHASGGGGEGQFWERRGSPKEGKARDVAVRTRTVDKGSDTSSRPVSPPCQGAANHRNSSDAGAGGRAGGGRAGDSQDLGDGRKLSRASSARSSESGKPRTPTKTASRVAGLAAMSGAAGMGAFALLGRIMSPQGSYGMFVCKWVRVWWVSVCTGLLWYVRL